MAKQAGNGCLFNVFNIGFTVVMFALPTVLLAYWYMYIRDPGGQRTQTIVVQQNTDEASRNTPNPGMSPTDARRPNDAIKSSGIFSENPTGVNAISPGRSVQAPTTQPEARRHTTRQAPVRGEYEMRTWSDPSGKFSIEAKFYSATTDKVKLLRPDDQKIEVEIAKLSDDDKQYLRDLFKSKGLKAQF